MSEYGDMDDIVKEFLVESYEGLDQLERDLVSLEQRPKDKDLLGSIFRCIHSIKGTCGFLGFAKLESVAHAGESLLSLMRDGSLVLNAELASALLAVVDAVREILTAIEAGGKEGEGDYGPLIERLEQLKDGGKGQQSEAAAAELPSEAEEMSEPPSAADGSAVAASVSADELPQPPADVGDDVSPGVPPNGGQEAQSQARTSSVSDNNIRVEVGLLDKLMNLVGELVLARNQVLQFSATQEDSGFVATTQRLNLITTELQEGVMKTRMQPIGNVWSKFPRVVRDLARASGKLVRIQMEGKETEIDKTLIEAIRDPLTHVIRNAVDHGIELPEERAKRGKKGEGRLLLRAFHEGGQVNIEISDDGAGLDPEKIKDQAVKGGLITREQSLQMSPREVVNIIFKAGFSTAERVTNVSGRGVGMDVVKTNIERIGGTVEIQSRLGEGTTVKIKIPLTLAIIPALTITCGGDRYAIPQVSLVELVRLEGDRAQEAIDKIHGAPVYKLRGDLLPLLYLDRELGVAEDGATEDGARVVNIVVLHADGRQFGLVVEGVSDTEEIVVKPLSKQLKGIPVFAGATVMGDGSVALILDVPGLAQNAHVVSERGEQMDQVAAGRGHADNVLSLLLFQVGKAGRMAMPLIQVARLEEFAASSIEKAGDREVVQYRGEIMPLIRLADVFEAETDADAADDLQVVVYTQNDRSVGLVVERILDIVEEQIAVQRAASRHGLIESVVVQGKVTDMLDIESVIRKVDPSFLDAVSAAA